MKIRIKGNSIRYRLTKTEVETFCKNGYFEENTDFGTKKLRYAIKAKQGIDTLDVAFQDDTVTLFLNTQMSNHWFQSDEIGFNHIKKNENGTELTLLLEKDFVCMDETVEDQSDNYPNPKMAT